MDDDLRSFFEAVDDIVLVADESGAIVAANAAAAARLGYAPAELLGRALSDLHDPAPGDEAQATLAETLAGRRRVCHLPLRRADGSLLPVETRSWRSSWSGRPALVRLSRDLSPEEDLLQRFERIFRGHPVAMAVTTWEDLRFTDVNDAFLAKTGLDRAGVIGRTAAELDLLAAAEDHQALREAASRTGRIRPTTAAP